MDEFMMNLFSLIADQVRNKQELFDEEGEIVQNLVNVGYHLHEANAALTLMQTLVRKQTENFFGEVAVCPQPDIRTLSCEERARFTMEAFSFALKLTHLGLFTVDQREELLEKAMTIYPMRIEIGDIKSVVAVMLFTSSDERESPTFPNVRRIKATAWN